MEIETIAVIGDADGTYDFAEVPELVRPIRDRKADIVGTPLQSLILRRLHGVRVVDGRSGMRAFSLEAIRRLHLRTEGMELASEMVCRLVLSGPLGRLARPFSDGSRATRADGNAPNERTRDGRSRP